MKIEAYILCNNEERLMPYIMRHYSQFAQVIILESNSTDRTVEVANKLGAEVWKYDVKDEIDDSWITAVKNSCWFDSKADWVMIADADEFIYHKDLIKVLSAIDATIILPEFIEMFSTKFPTTKGQIYDEVNKGFSHDSSGGNKMNIFRPDRIMEMNYSPGCHAANPKGVVKLSSNSGILTLHMRNLSEKFTVDRTLRASKRMSEINKEHGWGDHCHITKEQIIKLYNEGLTKSTVVI